MRYEIQQWTFFGGWAASWTDDDKPVTFGTYFEAECELREFIDESERIAKEGGIPSAYRVEDYRIVEITDGQ